MRKLIALGVTLFLATAALTGCMPPGSPAPSDESSSSPTPAASGAPTVSETPSASPTPSPEPAARADFGFTYFRDANLGETWTQMTSALGHPVTPFAECHWLGLVEQTPGLDTTALWDTDISTTGINMFSMRAKGSSLTGPFPRNPEGIGIGSSQTEVLAAYPGTSVVPVTPFGEATVREIVVDDPDTDSQYAFGMSGAYGANIVDRVQWGTGGPGGVWDHLCEGS